ncbi:hypothetical protein P9112_005386 [Eukaryota sp. TZLM1-RC]
MSDNVQDEMRLKLEEWRRLKGRRVKRPAGSLGFKETPSVSKATPISKGSHLVSSTSSRTRTESKTNNRRSPDSMPIETPAPITAKSHFITQPEQTSAETTSKNSHTEQNSAKKSHLPPKTPKNLRRKVQQVEPDPSLEGYGSVVVLAERSVPRRHQESIGSKRAISPVRRSKRLNPELGSPCRPSTPLLSPSVGNKPVSGEPPNSPAYLPNPVVNSLDRTPKRPGTSSPMLSGSAFRKRFMGTPPPLLDEDPLDEPPSCVNNVVSPVIKTPVVQKKTVSKSKLSRTLESEVLDSPMIKKACIGDDFTVN